MRGSGSGSRAIFFDRDGTLNRELGYAVEISTLELLPHARSAVELARCSGFLTVMVTNQSGVARGMFSESAVVAANCRVMELCGGVDAVYYCPHHPSEGVAPYRQECRCRKPAPGMIESAARDLGLDLAHSWMIGDSGRDVAAGRSGGLGTVLVLSGMSTPEAARALLPAPDFVAVHALHAVEWIVKNGSRE